MAVVWKPDLNLAYILVIVFLGLLCIILMTSLRSFIYFTVTPSFVLMHSSDECVSTKLGVTVNHVLVSLALPFYDLALHLCVLSTI